MVSKLKLEEISKKDYKNILSLTSNKNVMKFIGNGKIWNEKVNKFIEYCLLEQKMLDEKREQFYFKIVSNKFIGLIGFHKFSPLKGYFLSVFIKEEEQSKGYYSKSVRLLSKIIKKRKPFNNLYLLVRDNNDKGNLVFSKKHVFIRNVIFKGLKMKLYKQSLNNLI